MNHSPKFPDMRPPPGAASQVRGLPTPAGYRQSVPVFDATDTGISAQRGERKRRLLWFAVAVALHAALLLGLWLTPALRLKWGPSPEDWVQVISVPKQSPEAPNLHAATAVKPVSPSAKVVKPVPMAARPPP
jgi:hypothetical protein